MDIQKFKETYKQVITESTNDSELKNYIRSIVEEVIKEMNSEEDSEEMEEAVKSKDYNVSKKHNIHAGNYPFILKAVNNIKGTKDLSINMSAKESDLDNMEKALDKNPSDKTVLDKLKMRFSMEEAVTQDARKDFKNNVLPVFKKIPDNGTINQEFKDAVENHVKEYGEKELANFMASEDGEMPKWYNTKSKTVKLGARKFVPKEKFD